MLSKTNYLLDNSILGNSKIKVIATPSTGTNHIAESVLINNKFQIISIKESKVIEDIYASSEFSFTLLLALVKKLSITCDNSKYGIWRENETQMRSNELYGEKIGLIGYGRIDRKMANFSKAFVNVFDFVVYSNGFSDASSKCFKTRFNNMVVICSVKVFNVQVALSFICKSFKKFIFTNKNR